MADQRERPDQRRAARRDHPRTVLAIETSNPSSGNAGVCVARVGPGTVDVLAEAELEAGVRGSDGVMLAVDAACGSAGITPAEIDEIALSIGPGGYTALRIAATTAKTLALACDALIVPVPVWAVAAEGVQAPQRPALIALAGKGDAAHLTRIDADGRGEVLGVVTAAALGEGIARTIVGDGHVPAVIVERCASLGITRIPIVLRASACVSASAWFEPVGIDAVEPDYAREPDAVTQWRARHTR